MYGLATPVDCELSKRKHKDEPQGEDVRSPFQHDKDRIVHSAAFRRLQYKTQVYVIHEGDLYRTRLTHSLEVAQIAGGIARQLEADSDLAEAIALAHDLGHAPFGHIGGDTLRDLLAKYDIPFDHNIQSYRIVTDLEERYTGFKGLNLTYATLEGILRHCTYFDEEEKIRLNIPEELEDEISTFWASNQPSIEAQIVNIADSIAYATHDIEDALEVGLLGWEEFKRLIDTYKISFVKTIVRDDLSKAVTEKIRHRMLSRFLIDKLIRETVAQTKSSLSSIRSNDEQLWEKARTAESPIVALSAELEQQLRTLLHDILFECVYREPRVIIMMQKGKRILDTLFTIFMEEDKVLPKRTQSRLTSYYRLSKNKQNSKSGKRMLARVVGDYIAGMTDKYAMDTYQLSTQAYEKAL